MVELAGFEAVPILVEQTTTIEDILMNISDSQVVLLDHNLGGSFTGRDVSERLPTTCRMISTSSDVEADSYCPQENRWPMKKPSRPQVAAELFKAKILG